MRSEDIIKRLYVVLESYDECGWHETVREAISEIESLRFALNRLVHDSMYKDHPEASQMALDALGKARL
jgi:hypothetical protein